MSRRKTPSVEPRRRATGKQGRTYRAHTPFHAAFYQFLERLLAPQFELHVEHVLYKEPQRVDVLVIRRERGGELRDDLELPSLWKHLGDLSLLEFKGPTDVLDVSDVSRLVGYGSQYGVKEGLAPGALTLGMIASAVSEEVVERVQQHGGELVRVSEGVWEGRLNGSSLFALETSVLWLGDQHERLWYILSPGMLKEPGRLKDLTDAQRMVYILMMDRLLTTSKEEEMMLKDFSRLKTEFEKVREEYVMTLPSALKLKGVPTSERLEGVPTSELLARVPTSERLEGVPTSERLEGVPTSELVKSIDKAKLLEALFSPEVLSEYPPEFYQELERKMRERVIRHRQPA
ncbi:MAG: hypothetical protein ACKO6N_05225 [Myxococcota bacterium]